ncbi:hypothetical protein [Candidatus Epulonipiscium viviparus]|uniref:hypothetical protein n=1 Tax=Candidatus Epulonipiscium viviparus TaxID=420336 RepID=UPI00273811D2|nr:hypothetical protein [Candidatus Epulopiscium viviparus]
MHSIPLSSTLNYDSTEPMLIMTQNVSSTSAGKFSNVYIKNISGKSLKNIQLRIHTTAIDIIDQIWSNIPSIHAFTPIGFNLVIQALPKSEVFHLMYSTRDPYNMHNRIVNTMQIEAFELIDEQRTSADHFDNTVTDATQAVQQRSQHVRSVYSRYSINEKHQFSGRYSKKYSSAKKF